MKQVRIRFGLLWWLMVILLCVGLPKAETTQTTFTTTSCPRLIDVCSCSLTDTDSGITYHKVSCHGAPYGDIHAQLPGLPVSVREVVINTNDVTPDVRILDLEELINLPELELFILVRSKIDEILPTSSADRLNSSLKTFQLTGSPLSNIESGTFKGLTDLNTLILSRNQLQNVSKHAFQGLHHLRSLTLSVNQLQELPCGVFKGLGELRSLRLDNNQLGTLPRCLFDDNLSNLDHLDLQQNRIKSIHTGTFSSLTNLTKLELSANRIENLYPGGLEGLLSLETLDLSNNVISGIHPGVFKDAGNLMHLDLTNNILTSVEMDTFQYMPKLRSLVLTLNPLHRIAPGAFVNLPNLEELLMNGVPRSALMGKGSFQGLDKVWRLEMKGTEVGTEAEEDFDPPIAHLPSIEQLNIAENELKSLNQHLLESLPSLWLATVGNNPFHCDCKVAWIRQVALDPSYVKLHPWVKLWKDANLEVNTPRCSSPARLKGRRIVDVNSEDLTCLPPIVVSNGPRHRVVREGEQLVLMARLTRGLPTSHWVLPGGTWVGSNQTIVLTKSRVVVQSREQVERDREMVVTLTLTDLTNRPDMCGEIKLVASNVAGKTEATFSAICETRRTGYQQAIGYKVENIPLKMTSRKGMSKTPPSEKTGVSSAAIIGICVLTVLMLTSSGVVMYSKCRKNSVYVKLKEEDGDEELHTEIPRHAKTYGATDDVTL